jgi:hypothetical protein
LTPRAVFHHNAEKQMYSSYVSRGNQPVRKPWWQRFSIKSIPTFEERRHAAPPVLIYQFGKVGSSSILDSLLPQWPGLVIHAHTLQRRDDEPAEITVARDILQRANERIFVITTVREPIARNISAFFQNFERETGISEKQAHTISIQELIAVFLKKYPHNTPLRWFDENFKNFTGIDVFEHDFPKLGIRIIRHQNIDLLLMLSEVPDWLKELAIKQLLSLDQFRLKTTNVGDNKRYAETYRQFLQAFTAPDWYMQQMYGSRFFLHFYAPHEDALKALWTRRLTAENFAENGVQLPTV